MKSFKQYVLEGVQKAKRKAEAAAREFTKATMTTGMPEKDIGALEDASLKAKRKLEQINAIRRPRVERAALRFAQAATDPRDLKTRTKDVMLDTNLNISSFEDGDISKRLLRQAKAEREATKKGNKK